MPALLILAVISWLFAGLRGSLRPKLTIRFYLPLLRCGPSAVLGLSSFHWPHTRYVCCCCWFPRLSLPMFDDDDFLARQISGHALVLPVPRPYLPGARNRPNFPRYRPHMNRSSRVSVRRKDLRKYAEGGARAGRK